MPVKTMKAMDAPEHWGELMTAVAGGAEVVLLDEQRPIARVVPMLPEAKPRIPGLHRGNVRMSEDFDEPLPEGFWTGEL